MGPKGIAVDRNGHIIAVDNKACCVFIFQSNGKLVTRFGARGSLDRQFAGTDDKHSEAAQLFVFAVLSMPKYGIRGFFLMIDDVCCDDCLF